MGPRTGRTWSQFIFQQHWYEAANIKGPCFVCKQYEGTFCELCLGPEELPRPSPPQPPSRSPLVKGRRCPDTGRPRRAILPGVPPRETHPPALIFCLVCNVCEGGFILAHQRVAKPQTYEVLVDGPGLE